MNYISAECESLSIGVILKRSPAEYFWSDQRFVFSFVKARIVLGQNE